MSKVEILLSTFNGEHYLSEQLRSIEKQLFTEWLLIARDDGSTDSSLEILNEFAQRFPDKMRIIDGRGKHLGACGSFSYLMTQTTADYVMFCDQDDVWLPDKIGRTLSCMNELIAEKGPETPLLVHCDMIVTDEKLKRLSNSFWSYRGIKYRNAARFNRQLISNAVTGCAMMINRSLLETATPIPDMAMVHDWWIAQVAAAFGQVRSIPDPMMLYRQHGKNRIGARGYSTIHFIQRICKNLFQGIERDKEDLTARSQVCHVSAFHEKYGEILSENNNILLVNYFRLYKMLPVFRFIIMIRYGFWRPGFFRNIAMGLKPALKEGHLK